ncbi:hypothetical protein B0H66DRAFT_603375 [Apodospora peruviana]|uniref:Uncharacterized protein n=1 Tax=Apodospora peruviana TaxID=516989 RepID=A0AAE0I5R2_9PEZI|nr:hypothetical protein B0H66DRAFT_603375 [Apodospora peruviana]
MSATAERTPLLEGRQGLPTPNGSYVQDPPIFLRVCHSPWSFMNQEALVYTRAGILAYLTVLEGMLIHYEIDYRKDEQDYSPWRIIFQFSSISFGLLWLYHLVVFCWSFTHLYYPDVDKDDHRWKYRVLAKMSPPAQTMRSRKRFLFSLFYTIAHVFAFMNVIIYWTILVPNGHGHLPKGGEQGGNEGGGDKGGGGNATAVMAPFGNNTGGSVEDIFTSGPWFPRFCILSLWGMSGLIAFFEMMVLNSVRRQVPVRSHIFWLMFALSLYLVWAAIGSILTGHYPFFWMNREEMGKTEIVSAYAAGFVLMGPAVFSFMYGLIGMRENLTQNQHGEHQPQPQPEPEPENQGGFNPRHIAENMIHGAREQVQNITGRGPA